MNVNDYFLTNEEFSLIEDGLGNLQTTPIPTKIATYYNSKNYISHNKNLSLIGVLYRLVQTFNLRYKRNIVEKYLTDKKGTILDFGCGNGCWLNYMSKYYNIIGYEPILLSNNVLIKSSLNDLDKKFDMITLWHVFEHVEHRYKTITWLKNHLKDNGKLIIALPNYKSYDSIHYKNYWAGYDVPRHIFHYSRTGFINFLKKNSLYVLKEYPLCWDSYYVSLLSEKYKKNKLWFINFLIHGTISNLYGLWTKEYSSIIYVVSRV